MENKTNDKKTSRSIPWYGIGILFSTFSVIVLLTVFCFSFYQIAFFSKQLQDDMTVLTQRVDAMQSSVASTQQQAAQSNDELKQAMAQLQQAQSGDQNTWRVIDAQYYVKLADAQLQVGNNIPLAIQLLQTADKEVHDINNPKLDSVRKALAEDIASLQGAPQVDYTGLYMRLSAMNEQLAKLPFLTKPVDSNVAQTSNNSEQAWWRRGLQDSWQTLQKIVVIRYHAAGKPPLVTPDQQDFLQQNLHSVLEKAMWAVLNKNNEIYHASLQQAANWIGQYYVKDSALTESVLSNLNQLQQLDIHPTVPRVTASLQAFHDYFL